ncbi:MAG: SNF2-related protein [Planctomycetota bacterium]
MPTGLHLIQRRYLAEELVRLRRADEARRFAAPQRAARVDPNPHQVDAVVFALERIPLGGCILADEVGLGKTIEAGLVIAQLLAEGATRILILGPKALLGQWRQELYDLFDIKARDGAPVPGGFDGDGVFLIGREAAAGPGGHEALLAADRFDLCVIDEAHEIFAGIYKRFDSKGQLRENAPDAQMAGRIREVLQAHNVPVLLLTATPIQNRLTELWGLVHYVDPANTLLGDLSTFRSLYCQDGDRIVAEGQEGELKGRLRQVVQRTLRRQAQPFLKRPFVNRQARLFTYEMEPEERSLYADVTDWLLRPGSVAFSVSNRSLLLLGFHRRMASSTRALAVSLDRVAERLRRLESGEVDDGSDDTRAFLSDFDDEELFAVPEESSDEAAYSPAKIRDELALVQSFAERARNLATDSKARALLRAVQVVLDQGAKGVGSSKVVVFTESLSTQDYLAQLLAESGIVSAGKITLFRGQNDSPRCLEALQRWRVEVESGLPPYARPNRASAIRSSLIHEFRTRTQVFISTEAGAKGLNLQFCDTVVNYDLPWNPQRIEQRIGRCHRYGQQRDVTVVNFIAKDNAAEQLLFEILSQKLELFGTVLDATDQVLHTSPGSGGGLLVSTIGSSFEEQLNRIYQRARTRQEVEAEMEALREKIAAERESFEETHARTAGLIEAHFDDEVRAVFRRREEELPVALRALDQDLERLVCAYLLALGVEHSVSESGEERHLQVAGNAELPEAIREGFTCAIGRTNTEHESLHLQHPLVTAALEDVRAVSGPLTVEVTVAPDSPTGLRALAGKQGLLTLIKVRHEGLSPVERLLPVLVLESGEPIPVDDAHELMTSCSFVDLHDSAHIEVDEDDVADAIDEAVFIDQGALAEGERDRYEQAVERLDRFIEDRALVLRRRRVVEQARLDEAKTRREAALGADARDRAEAQVRASESELEQIDAALGRLERRDDADYQRLLELTRKRGFVAPVVERLLEARVRFA